MTYLRETYQPGLPPSGDDPPVASPWPVTIAVLTRNEQRCVSRCLDSVLACPVDAVMVVDTGSTDRTLDIVEAYRDSRIEVVRYRWDDSFADARAWRSGAHVPAGSSSSTPTNG
ncbi:glycosyltransferase [Couchioplanes caeruleus]|uniref:glycosyltransferase n=1 Tax=Couchioplanes caeruleus TaxID=56438 RepID=UPI0020BE2BDD|nr:glycosyltransferase [Couchioplanes caeruleus]UQU63732.1 glycosyltransferase [Couchioplanes caeruleus]